MVVSQTTLLLMLKPHFAGSSDDANVQLLLNKGLFGRLHRRARFIGSLPTICEFR